MDQRVLMIHPFISMDGFEAQMFLWTTFCCYLVQWASCSVVSMDGFETFCCNMDHPVKRRNYFFIGINVRFPWQQFHFYVLFLLNVICCGVRVAPSYVVDHLYFPRTNGFNLNRGPQVRVVSLSVLGHCTNRVLLDKL